MFTFSAINLYDSLKLKSLKGILQGKVIRSTPQEWHLQYGENAYLFAFRFGGLVFFNMSQDAIDSEMARIKSVLGEGVPNPTTETYRVLLGETLRVEFEFAELKKLSLDHLRLVAVALGQSAALEYFELIVDKMLGETWNLLQGLARVGSIPTREKKLHQIIGSAASARQHILSNIAVLDPPDEAWQSKELGKFHDELQQNFDIELRFRVLDRKLALIQDNNELIARFAASRKTTILEGLVVLLIFIEIALVLTGFLRH